MILVIIKFCELSLSVSLTEAVSNTRKSVSSDIQTLRSWFKKLNCAWFFSTHFSVFGYLMKHSSMCLMYYIRNSPSLLEALTSPRLRQIVHLVAGKGIPLGVGRGCSWPITTMFFPHKFHQFNHWVLLYLL